MLSGYRLMWMMVMFDLPVLEKQERKEAADFRKALLDMGFEMCQFSVYTRFCSSHSQYDTYLKRVEAMLPAGGKVNVLQFTDKQYERIVTFQRAARQPATKPPEQFELF